MRLEPRGEQRDDWRIARAVCQMIRWQPGRGRGRTPDEKDLLLAFAEPAEVTPEGVEIGVAGSPGRAKADEILAKLQQLFPEKA